MQDRSGTVFLTAVFIVTLLAVTIPASTGPAMAATFAVNSTIDAVDANPGDGVCETVPENGVCTLRAAIQEHNALGGANSIKLPEGIFALTISGVDLDVAAAGDLGVAGGKLTITGAGASATIVDGGRIDRVFSVIDPSTEVIISDITIRNGDSILSGGGIGNNGILTLTDVTVYGNTASDGGGISNEGTLTMTRGRINGNAASQTGGGVSNSGTATLSHVAITDNTATNAGGIDNAGSLALTNITLSGNVAAWNCGGIGNGGTATLTNLTLSNNSAGLAGGGMSNGLILTSDGIIHVGTVTLTNVTVNGNSAPTGGGIMNAGAVTIGNTTFESKATMRNTIISNNLIGGNCVGSLIISEGHNLSSDNTCNFTGPGDIINSNPLLGPLTDNGGRVQTHALLAGSPAIDAGDNLACPATDARGVIRPRNGDGDGTAKCDIGAFEVCFAAFSDVPLGAFAEDFMKTVFCHGISVGCGNGNFCPDSPVTRAQMAVFLLTAMGEQPAAACTGTVFNDVNSAVMTDAFCRNIEKFATLGITTGCQVDDPQTPVNEARYCPDDPVTRAQMAVFMTTALRQGPEASCNGTFNDVNAGMVGDVFCRFIEKFATLGITGGCGNGNYCPNDPVTRAQMAVFLTVGFLQ